MDGPSYLLWALGALATAALCALGLTPLARLAALRLGAVDRPDGVRKLHARPTPLLGGVAVYLSLLAGAAWCVVPGGSVGSLVATALSLGLLCGLGVCDDVLNLKAGQKFLAQVIVVLPIACGGDAIERVGFFGAELPLGALGPVLSAFWLAACINAINLIDGVDGLACVTGVCVALPAAVLAACTGAEPVVIGAAALCGALVGFLFYNRPPARIYLGDAGSMTIGAALGLLSMRAARGTFGGTSLPLMLMLMAVPLGDTTLAILRRWLSGQSIWRADRGHIHHRLLERGLSAGQLLVTVAGVCLLTGGIAVLARMIEFDGLGFVALATLTLGLVKARLMGHHEWSLLKQALVDRWRPAPAIASLGQLAGMPFAAAWSSLVTAASQLSASRLMLTIEQPHSRTRRHQWTADAAGPRLARQAAIDLRLPTGDGGWCQVQLEAGDIQPQGPLWDAFVAALWQCTCHWAHNALEVPGEGLRLHEPDDGAAPQRQAA